jgi:uncharacterized membrane protein YfcA
MIENDIIYLILFLLLTILQTIVGVGILVLGTPILLILNLNIIDAMSILLPISILTSLMNLIYLKLNDKISIRKLESGIKKFFFTICVPSIFFGTILLKYFQESINFKILVSIIILTSLIVKKFHNSFFFKMTKLKKKLLLFVVGFIHGVSNSGGSLLSIFILKINNDLKNQTRPSLTFFYFFLALIQYIIFIFFFQKLISIKLLINLVMITLIGVLIGNISIRFINDNKFNFLIEFLTLVTVFSLLLNS